MSVARRLATDANHPAGLNGILPPRKIAAAQPKTRSRQSARLRIHFFADPAARLPSLARNRLLRADSLMAYALCAENASAAEHIGRSFQKFHPASIAEFTAAQTKSVAKELPNDRGTPIANLAALCAVANLDLLSAGRLSLPC